MQAKKNVILFFDFIEELYINPLFYFRIFLLFTLIYVIIRINIYKKRYTYTLFTFSYDFYCFRTKFFEKKGPKMNELNDIVALMLENIKEQLSSPTIFNLWLIESGRTLHFNPVSSSVQK